MAHVLRTTCLYTPVDCLARRRPPGGRLPPHACALLSSCSPAHHRTLAPSPPPPRPPPAPAAPLQIAAAEFTPDGAFLATGSLDSSVILWEVATGRAVALFVGDAAVTCLAWATPPGRDPGACRSDGGGGGGGGSLAAAQPHTLVVGDAGGQVHFLCGLPLE
jgi:hypothetical protein